MNTQMKIQYQKLNPEYEINKMQIHDTKEPITRKTEDQKNYTRIEPLIPVRVAKNLILSNDLLSTCIETLSQDIILNEINILNNELEQVNSNITDFWNTNTIYELYLALQDRIGYGYGALEIIFNADGTPAALKQISAETLTISVEQNRYETNQQSYYALYNNGTEHIKMKLSRYNYTPEDDELQTVLWLGGGRVSDYYDIPVWLPAFNKISADALLDELNAKKINEGNLISGILTVVSPPMNKTIVNEETGEVTKITGKEQIDNTLHEQMTSAGTGIMTLHLQQLTAELPLNVQYIPITESNYDYLRNLAEDCDNSILRLFKIPKVRLMIDDVKESMNSNKSDTIWEIYTKELISLQKVYEGIITVFNNKYFQTETIIDIEVPIFSDKKQIEVESTIKLFNNGLLTLNQALKNLKQYYPELDIEEDRTLDGRYYNGQVLGMADYEEETTNTDLEELYAFFDLQSNE